MLEAVAAQADDRLEQQAEAVVLQCLLDHGQQVATVGRGGEFLGRVVELQAVLVAQFVGAAVGAVHHVLGLGRGFAEAGDADAQAELHGAATDVEQVDIDLLQQAAQAFLGLFGREALLQHAEHIVAVARQLGIPGEVGAQQVGQVGEQQVDAGDADLGQQAGVAGNPDVGEAGRLPRLDRTLGGSVEQFVEVGAVEQAGDQVLAADLAQFLFQLGAVGFGADHDLDAGFAIVGGGGEAHARLERLAVHLAAIAGEFAAAFAIAVVLQEVLEAGLVGAGDQVDHRHAFEFVAIVVAEHLHIGAVGIDMHAVVDVGDGVHRAVQQQLATLLRLAQADFGGASRTALLEVGQFAVGHQHQALVLALGQGVLRAQGQGFGDQV
ncbi:hypothetical protein D9M68_549730 [compost metagenome]